MTGVYDIVQIFVAGMVFGFIGAFLAITALVAINKRMK